MEKIWANVNGVVVVVADVVVVVVGGGGGIVIVEKVNFVIRKREMRKKRKFIYFWGPSKSRLDKKRPPVNELFLNFDWLIVYYWLSTVT